MESEQSSRRIRFAHDRPNPDAELLHALEPGLETRSPMRTPAALTAVTAAAAVLVAAAVTVTVTVRAATYPRTLVAQAKASNGATSVTSTVTIKIDRLVEPSRRTRVVDGLKYNGYQGFMNALR